METPRVSPVFISSSTIDAVGYRLGTLYVRFKSGASYSYDKVPHYYFDSLSKVESAGRMFHQFIKGKFRYTRLDKDPFTA